MRAAWIAERGPASNIRVSTFRDPDVGAADVLIRTEAVAVDPVDILVRSGRYHTDIPFPFVVGRDVVGTVERVGSAVHTVMPGERVFSNSLGHAGRQGATAELVAVAAERVYRLPPGVDPVRAAALLHPVATAHLALFTHGRLEVGSARPVVVAGGAGNVGSAMVMLAARAGARVISTAGAADLSYTASLGSQVSIDYRSESWIEQIASAVAGEPVLAVDTSGALGFEWVLSFAAPRSAIVVMAGFGRSFALPVGPLYASTIRIDGFSISTATIGELAQAAESVINLLATSDVSSRSVQVIGFDEVRDAHEQIENGTAGSTRFVVVPGV